MSFDGPVKYPHRPSANSSASSITVPLVADDPQYRAALLARASKTAMRIAAAAANGRDKQVESRADADRRIEENCQKKMLKREAAAAKRREHKAREEESRQAKAEKRAEAAAKKQRKADEKAEEARLKAEKKAAKVREKALRRYLGGTAWGFDANAGVKHPSDCLPADITSSIYHSGEGETDRRTVSHTSGSRDSTPQYYDRVTGKYYSKNEFDSIWGIEIGGPTHLAKPGPHRDRFAQAMAEVNKTASSDPGWMSRDPEPSSPVAAADSKGKAKAGRQQFL